MRILVVGAGGVGSAVVPIAVRRDFFERMVVADYDVGRAERAVARFPDDRAGSPRRRSTRLAPRTSPRSAASTRSPTSSTPSTRASSCRSSRAPSRRAPTTSTWRCPCRTQTRTRRTSGPAIKLGDEQFAKAADWEGAGRLALVGIGVEPGLSDVFARYAQDHLFSEIDEVGIRDGANLVVDGYDFAPSFSIWTTIEECLNPPVIWEADRGWYTTPPFSEPEVFDFPEGIGPVECVNVEHEEVLLVPRWVGRQAGDLQVRPRRRVHQRPEGAPHARARPDRQGPGRWGRGVAAGRGRRLPAGPGPARRPDARQDVCRDVGDRAPARTASRGRSTSITWSTTR